MSNHYNEISSEMLNIYRSILDSSNEDDMNVIIRNTGVSAVYHTTDENLNMVHTTLERLYKSLQDDFDITRGCAESRVRKLKDWMLNNISDELKKDIFFIDDNSGDTFLTTYQFIVRLTEYVIRNIKTNERGEY